MGIQASRYNVFGVEDFWVSSQDIFDSYWVDVMNQNSITQFEIWMRKIAAIVSNNDVVSEVEPLARMVEYLIQISIVTKCIGTNSTTDLEIPVTFNECWDGD